MYAHPKFRTATDEMALEIIENHPFANLVTSGHSGLRSSHLPVVLAKDNDRSAVADGRWTSLKLVGHMARANPQVDDLDDADALLLFQTPHAYISPSWYATTPAAPTWNYVDVQVRGRLVAHHRPAEVLDVLLHTVETLERDRHTPWFPDKSMDYVHKIMGGVASFEVEVRSVDYQFKLSQDKGPEIAARVIDGLKAGESEAEHAVADLMSRYLPRMRRP